jgi:uncharacterized protein
VSATAGAIGAAAASHASVGEQVPDAVLDFPQFLILATVTLLGALIQATFGFGFAILAAPIFLAVLDSRSAIQVLVILHVVLSAIVVPGMRRGVPTGLLGWLMAGSLLGFPIGLAFFLRTDIQTLKLAVGIATILFSLLLIKREWQPATTPIIASDGIFEFRRMTALAIGLLSGALTAVLVMPGPAAMLYLRALGLAKQTSRATSLTFFAFCYVMATALHAAVAGIGSDSWMLAIYLLPAVVVGSLAGNAAAHRLSEEHFRNAVLALLIASGIYAIWSALS